ncbi:HNH endonuclease [Mycolicibacterium fortuitum]|uniref:HNH endonuclease n=1 Tax=Mycolicibacterium fortuitum TaxID=1766 RepID=UPI003AAB55BD
MTADVVQLAGRSGVTEWRPVVGYEGRYLVSNTGFVWIVRKQRLLGMELSDSGHLTVQLWRNNRKRRLQVHCLVLEAFVGPRPEGLECCHYDGDAFNNNVINLRWDTRSANTYDAYRHKAMRALSA